MEFVKRISFAQCQAVSEHIFKRPVDEGRKPIAIAITDQAANLIYTAHMDGIHTRGGEIARAKAFTSARMHRTTKNLREYCIAQNVELAMFACPGVTSMPGGAPIYDAEGTLIGGVGISGWSAEEDQMLADDCAAFLLELMKG